MTTSDRILAALSNLLWDDRLVDIEILPGDGSDFVTEGSANSHAPFLFVEGHLGVPIKVLYKVYVIALKEFGIAKRDLPRNGPKPTSEAGAIEELNRSSSVIVLTNPDHNTALNRRKWLVEQGYVDPAEELRFVGMVLGIARSAKASLLWHHRRWLLWRVCGPKMGIQGLDSAERLEHVDLPQDTLRKEFELADKAAGLYPRNYYAWSHRFKCLQSLARPGGELGGKQVETADLLVSEQRTVRQWVERNVSDHTAMQYLCRVEGVARVLLGDEGMSRSGMQSSTQHALSLLERYPEHEGLWLYVREAHMVAETSALQPLPSRAGVLAMLDSQRAPIWIRGGEGTKVAHGESLPLEAAENLEAEVVERLKNRHEIWEGLVGVNLELPALKQ